MSDERAGETALFRFQPPEAIKSAHPIAQAIKSDHPIAQAIKSVLCS
ncbi:MAG: hypothetical protein IOC63_04895 [Methylobacterium sp.]|nr:hypothetical protein [Methylobacterium sp.]